MLLLYNFPCNTTNAFDHRVILLASTASSNNFLFIMYSRYGCIQVSSIIMTSSGSGALSSFFAPALESIAGVELLTFFIDLSTISS
jgi:hypothetical protein